jgi:hypothetical protein
MATQAEILISLLSELNRFDEHVGVLVRANRGRIALTGGRIADSFEPFAAIGSPRRRHTSFLQTPSRSRHR